MWRLRECLLGRLALLPDVRWKAARTRPKGCSRGHRAVAAAFGHQTANDGADAADTAADTGSAADGQTSQKATLGTYAAAVAGCAANDQR